MNNKHKIFGIHLKKRKIALLFFLYEAIFLIISNATETNKDRFSAEDLIKFLRSRQHLKTQAAIENYDNTKCGFWLNAEIVKNWNKFTELQKAEISYLMQPPSMQCTTSVGHFRIMYDTVGENMPSLLDESNAPIPGTSRAYVDSVGRIFNYVWEVLIEQMEFEKPPIKDSLYEVYIENIYEFGVTMFDDPPINNSEPYRYYSYIIIDNDFCEKRTKGMAGLKVTAAHEFHHAIQLGYGFWPNDIYANELTSTWIEDVVYTDVNDYYYELPKYFFSYITYSSYITGGFWAGRPFYFYDPQMAGYERCIWAHFLSKKYGQNIMRKIWEKMQTKPFLESTDDILHQYNTNLAAAFGEFTYWNYFTADRANPDKYYPEGEHYPRFRPLQQTNLSSNSITMNANVYELSSTMYECAIGIDTISIIVANIDVRAGINREFSERNLQITISTSNIEPPYTQLANGARVKISVSDNIENWHYFIPEISKHRDASPNPCILSKSNQLQLPIEDDIAKIAEVYFYAPSLELAYFGTFNVAYEYGTRFISVPTAVIKEKLASGIYIVVAKTFRKNYKWKVAIIK